MIRLLNVLIFFFLGLIIFLIVIHIRKTEYFQSSGTIYSGKVAVTTYFIKDEQDDYLFQLSFNHIATDVVINNLDIHLLNIQTGESDEFPLIKIRPYSGMQPWDIPEHKSFGAIPDSLKKLNPGSNPYFAYDFIFERDPKMETNQLLAKIDLSFLENGHERKVLKDLVIKKATKTELKALDAHSDPTLAFVPILGIITILLIFIRFRYKSKRKSLP